MEPLQLWPTLKQIKGESYPELFSVIELCLCAPFSNATLERFFSHMAVVKNDWRNRLGEEALEDNLRIHISGPCAFTFLVHSHFWSFTFLVISVADSERSSEEENTDTLHSQVNDYENDKHT
jgi:hypothetical protein